MPISKLPSTISTPKKNPLATTSLPVKSSKNCPLSASHPTLQCRPASQLLPLPKESCTHHPYPKTWEPPHALISYRPISLLPIVSKVLEKLLLTRLLPIVEHNGLIPSHQFGFRQRHSTTEQTHRIVHKTSEAFEHKAYYFEAFLDIPKPLTKYGMSAFYTS
jgi:hypothetical protein